MSRVPILALFLFAWLAVFAQTQFPVLTNLLHLPVTVLPALMVFAALTHGIVAVAGLAVWAGLGADALSAHPIGISILPLFVVGFLLHLRRHLILREQTYAQFWLGLGAGVSVPTLTLLMLYLDSQRPVLGPFHLWQILLTGLLNGLLCPALFRLFDALRRTFDYQPMAESSFRPDREIKRGRL